jgi:hypothetical protein
MMSYAIKVNNTNMSSTNRNYSNPYWNMNNYTRNHTRNTFAMSRNIY